MSTPERLNVGSVAVPVTLYVFRSRGRSTGSDACTFMLSRPDTSNGTLTPRSLISCARSTSFRFRLMSRYVGGVAAGAGLVMSPLGRRPTALVPASVTARPTALMPPWMAPVTARVTDASGSGGAWRRTVAKGVPSTEYRVPSANGDSLLGTWHAVLGTGYWVLSTRYSARSIGLAGSRPSFA